MRSNAIATGFLIKRLSTVRYSSLSECVSDLEKNKRLLRIKEEVDPYLEMASLHRRVFEAGGPALLFEKVKGSSFPAVSNLFGTVERAEFIFRDTLPLVKEAMRLKASPEEFLKIMWKNRFRPYSTYFKLPFVGLSSLPKQISVTKSPVAYKETTVSALPQIVCWKEDGGAFMTQPQVFSRSPKNSSILKSNLGMYRVQMNGNDYVKDQEVGLHYQIHRGIGVHHSEALSEGKDLPVTIFVGGHPAHALAAVMPMPEGVSELLFAGMLGGRRFRYSLVGEHVISSDADFCILGWVRGRKTKREGPFGDHLGYYSLEHEFPYLEVTKVYHRKDAIWPFTVVGRPPQEDSCFGALIHSLTHSLVPSEIPGVKELHAVDEAGVHPLLLAIGSERYVPYRKREPLELMTQSNSILGFGQCSLAKYLFLVAREDNENLRASEIKDFFIHLLERVDFRRDLHFQTKVTVDTLDYSGESLNKGSKLIITTCGDKIRNLGREFLSFQVSDIWKNPLLVMPGVVAVTLPGFTNYEEEQEKIKRDLEKIPQKIAQSYPLIVLVDNSEFVAEKFSNFLWVTFTRSNPSHDVYGVGSFTKFKHWGCEGSLVLDARIKPHHAPPLLEDSQIEEKVDRMMRKIGF
jgi:4-hydroxy-3-polyprenylbenzoate decarboxylase